MKLEPKKKIKLQNVVKGEKKSTMKVQQKGKIHLLVMQAGKRNIAMQAGKRKNQ